MPDNIEQSPDCCADCGRRPPDCAKLIECDDCQTIRCLNCWEDGVFVDDEKDWPSPSCCFITQQRIIECEYEWERREHRRCADQL